MSKENELRKENDRLLLKYALSAGIVIAVLMGWLIWVSLKDPSAANNLKDLVIVLSLVIPMVLGLVLIYLCAVWIERLKTAGDSVKRVLAEGEGKIERVAPLVDRMLNGLAEPFLAGRSTAAGVRSALTRLFRKD